MNNYYALKLLTKHLTKSIEGSKFLFSYSPYKDVWELYLEVNPSHKRRLIFSTNSSEASLFLDEDRPHKKSNVTTFFEQLSEDKLIKISLSENDRFVTLLFDSGKSLLLLPFGNHPNVFMAEDGFILESFKQGSHFEGKPVPVPRQIKRTQSAPQGNIPPKKVILAEYPAFPRHLISLLIDHHHFNEKSTADILHTMSEIVNAMENKPEFRVLENGNLCLIPERLLPMPNRKIFDNINDAIKFAYYKTSSERRLSAKINSLKPKLEQAIRKHESAIEQLSNAGQGLERAEKYEQYGHILMAHAHQSVPDNSGTIELPDLYNENRLLKIPVKPFLSIAENAGVYYNKSAGAIRNVEESERRLKIMKNENEELNKLLNSLNGLEKVYQFEEWYNTHEEPLRQLGILSKIQNEKPLPFRKTEIDGYEVWIGKNARSNDEVTTRAHKEDVWLHARGVSGSHVVIRMENRKEMPPKSTLLKAAAAAAWNSKARGSKLAPVIVTKRKYVTKPKGSATGAVRVQREDVELVEPKKAP
jgi:predicted ribosome quality control (RQC) complex YloA/Tae2 family protein